MSAQRGSDLWLGELRAFFADVHPRLTEVLDAGGCRELWLQGEAFRYFRARNKGYDFRVNHYPLVLPGAKAGETKRQHKADMAFFDGDDRNALACVGELKLYGTVGYQDKCLNGCPLKPYLARVNAGESLVFKNDASLDDQAHGGLVWDYYRLARHCDPASADATRVLVLVLDCRAKKQKKEPNSFGRVVEKVEFEKAATVILDTGELLVKAWTVTAPV